MMKRICILSAVFLTSHAVRADDAADIEALKKQVAELSSRFEKMEKKATEAKAAEAKAGVPVRVKGAEKLTISGLMQVNYRGYDGQTAGFERTNTFQLRRASLSLEGQISRRIKAELGVNFAKRLRLIRAPLAGQG